MEIEIRKATYLDWEIIRRIRNFQKEGFVDQHDITIKEHHDFMIENHEHYYVAVQNGNFSFGSYQVLGFVGIKFNTWQLDSIGDIRFAVHPYWPKQGVGTKMLQFIKEKYPQAVGKVKKNNIASNKAFEKAGYINIAWHVDKNGQEFNTWISPDADAKKFKWLEISE